MAGLGINLKKKISQWTHQALIKMIQILKVLVPKSGTREYFALSWSESNIL
jgi:hypothetical protein